MAISGTDGVTHGVERTLENTEYSVPKCERRLLSARRYFLKNCGPNGKLSAAANHADVETHGVKRTLGNTEYSVPKCKRRLIFAKRYFLKNCGQNGKFSAAAANHAEEIDLKESADRNFLEEIESADCEPFYSPRTGKLCARRDFPKNCGPYGKFSAKESANSNYLPEAFYQSDQESCNEPVGFERETEEVQSESVDQINGRTESETSYQCSNEVEEGDELQSRIC